LLGCDEGLVVVGTAEGSEDAGALLGSEDGFMVVGTAEGFEVTVVHLHYFRKRCDISECNASIIRTF
jgi:hypothetical protein